jgi:hypothetical protein
MIFRTSFRDNAQHLDLTNLWSRCAHCVQRFNFIGEINHKCSRLAGACR